MRSILRYTLPFILVAVLIFIYFYFRRSYSGNQNAKRGQMAGEWVSNPGSHPDWTLKALDRCEGAPFVMPVDGYIGFLWDDSFRPGHRHSGLDIFSGTDPGLTPVVAVYDGYLTRLPDWKSTVIIRIPQDPLQPNRQIWLYYTHMADLDGNSYIGSEYPPGTKEKFVKVGTYLGKVGNYSGNEGNPVWPHLHFSIVKDDGKGHFTNELDIRNTLDPSPYFGRNLNGPNNPGDLPLCVPTVGSTHG